MTKMNKRLENVKALHTAGNNSVLSTAAFLNSIIGSNVFLEASVALRNRDVDALKAFALKADAPFKDAANDYAAALYDGLVFDAFVALFRDTAKD